MEGTGGAEAAEEADTGAEASGAPPPGSAPGRCPGRSADASGRLLIASAASCSHSGGVSRKDVAFKSMRCCRPVVDSSREPSVVPYRSS
ncbi:hypothetical protein AB0L49_07715 [Streptomyces antimycoticus]